MRTRFHFRREVERYHQAILADPYPRLMAWEFMWDWVRSQRSRRALASPRNARTTALHLGFYLANWGMLRGRSALLNTNLEFFEALVEHLFAGSGVPKQFWSLEFEQFDAGGPGHARVVEIFDQGVSRLREFEKDRVSWTDTLVSKVLMGVWGQIPAYDRFFNAGWRAMARANAKAGLPTSLGADGASLSEIVRTQRWFGWNLSGFETRRGGNRYPPGKVIDMAFFQYGTRQA